MFVYYKHQSKASLTVLNESDLLGVTAETLSAAIQTILPDKPV